MSIFSACPCGHIATGVETPFIFLSHLSSNAHGIDKYVCCPSQLIIVVCLPHMYIVMMYTV